MVLHEVIKSAPPTTNRHINITTKQPHQTTGPPVTRVAKIPKKACKDVPNIWRPKKSSNPITQRKTAPIDKKSSVPVSIF